MTQIIDCRDDAEREAWNKAYIEAAGTPNTPLYDRVITSCESANAAVLAHREKQPEMISNWAFIGKHLKCICGLCGYTTYIKADGPNCDEVTEGCISHQSKCPGRAKQEAPGIDYGEPWKMAEGCTRDRDGDRAYERDYAAKCERVVACVNAMGPIGDKPRIPDPMKWREEIEAEIAYRIEECETASQENASLKRKLQEADLLYEQNIASLKARIAELDTRLATKYWEGIREDNAKLRKRVAELEYGLHVRDEAIQLDNATIDNLKNVRARYRAALEQYKDFKNWRNQDNRTSVVWTHPKNIMGPVVAQVALQGSEPAQPVPDQSERIAELERDRDLAEDRHEKDLVLISQLREECSQLRDYNNIKQLEQRSDDLLRKNEILQTEIGMAQRDLSDERKHADELADEMKYCLHGYSDNCWCKNCERITGTLARHASRRTAK